MRALSGLRALGAVAVAGLAVLVAPGVALADPPGPTDFATTIVSVVPPTETVHVAMVAGDAFFTLSVAAGTHVTVAGYQGEPYLEFLPTGEVLENRRSPTYFASRTKSGAAVPTGITADTPPEWTAVASDGTYAWHDHRTHWMGGTPTGARGDVVANGAVRLVVDGEEVVVTVATTWLPRASPVPALLGLLAGAAAGAGYVVARRRGAAWADAVLVVAAALATVVGFVGYRSVPGVTGPSPLGWVLPATALVAATAGVLLTRRPAWALFAVGARALAGVELAIWAITRRSGLLAAILPTDAPFWLDRAATTAAGAVGVIVAAMAAAHLVDLLTRPPAPTPRSAPTPEVAE